MAEKGTKASEPAGTRVTLPDGQIARVTKSGGHYRIEGGPNDGKLWQGAAAPAPGTPPPPAPPPPQSSAGQFNFSQLGAPTKLNNEAFMALQRQTEQEGRRITLQEWQSVGGNPYEYYKIYGSPDQAALTAFINQAQAQNRRVTMEEFLAAGGNPNDFYKLYGENNPDPVKMSEAQARAKQEGRRLTLQEWIEAGGNPWQYEQQTAQAPYDQGVASPGTKTDGTEIGDVREINPSTIEDTPLPERTDIAPVINAEVDAQTMAQQRAFAAALEEAAAGRGPSVAGLQLQQALERSLKNQMGAFAANPAISSALAARLFGYQGAQQQQEAAMAAAIKRVEEQQAARESLNTVLANIQDANLRVALANQLAGNTQNYNQAQLYQEIERLKAAQLAEQAEKQATLNQDAAKANQGAFNTANIAQGQIAGGIKQSEIGASATLGAAGLAAEAAKDVASINQDTAVITGAQDNASDDSTVDAPTQNTNNSNSSTTTGGGGRPGTPGATIGGTRSDKKDKKNISDGSNEAREMMEELAAAIYEYKNKNDGDGRQVGVMAQDLEKSKLGKQMVDQKDGSKWINFAKGLGAVLAAQADINERLKNIEARA